VQADEEALLLLLHSWSRVEEILNVWTWVVNMKVFMKLNPVFDCGWHSFVGGVHHSWPGFNWP